MDRERQTVAAMIGLYCRSHHGADGLCSECAELLVYASERLEKCPFQEGKEGPVVLHGESLLLQLARGSRLCMEPAAAPHRRQQQD